MTAYDVTVTREDDLWVAVVHGLRAGATDTPSFSDLDVEVRDIIADLTDTDPDDFAINWHYVLNEVDITEHLQRLMAVEAELRDRLAERDAVRLDTVTSMARAGVSQRVIADAIGVSHQRISQLING